MKNVYLINFLSYHNFKLVKELVLCLKIMYDCH